MPASTSVGLLLVLVAQCGDLGVAEQRVVVEGDFGVERHQLARSGHHQRVDFGDRGVEFGEGAIERRHEIDRDADLFAFEPQAIRNLAGMEWLDPAGRVDRDLEDLVGRMLGNLFDLDPALGRARSG